MPSAEMLVLLHEVRLGELQALGRIDTAEYREVEAHIKELKRWAEKLRQWH
jgi:hypothetical protein